MNQQEIEKLLLKLQSIPKECEWVEFKVDNSNPQEIGEYISALSNSAYYHKQDYGYLVFGIEEHNYAIASRIIGDTKIAKLIRDYYPDNRSRTYAKYVPFWF
jgi:predicted HTH transcriptional regulator